MIRTYIQRRSIGWLRGSVYPMLMVPQQECYLVERLGAYSRSMSGGPMFKIPFLERVSGVQVLKEINIEINKQNAITKDNVTVGLDGVLYIKIFDPYKTQYGVVDAANAVTNLAQTSMRSEIGKMQLDGVFSERENLNRQIVKAINSAAEDWGIRALRYEIRDIEIPKEIQHAMQMQVGAERQKRATILESEGVKQAAINAAEGAAEALLIDARAKAAAITAVSEQIEKGHGMEAARLQLASGYIDAFGKLAKEGNTLILPADTGDVSSMLAKAMKTVDVVQTKKEPAT